MNGSKNQKAARAIRAASGAVTLAPIAGMIFFIVVTVGKRNMSDETFILCIISVVLGCHAIWYGIIEFLRDVRERKANEEEYRVYKLVNKALECWHASIQTYINDVDTLKNRVNRLDQSVQINQQQKKK